MEHINPALYLVKCKVLPLSTSLEFNFNNSLVWELVLGLNCHNLFPGQNFRSVTKTFPEPTKLSQELDLDGASQGKPGLELFCSRNKI